MKKLLVVLPMKYISLLALTLLLNISCDTKPRTRIENYYQKDYKNIDSLMSFYKKIPEAKDTVFLGFRLGMTKKEYRNHIKSLRSDGKTIKYERDLGVTSVLVKLRIELGDRYVYYSPITMDDMTGAARCILMPGYGQNGKMLSLKIISFEDWDKSYFGLKKWLDYNVRKKYPNWYDDTKNLNSVISSVCEDILEGEITDAYPGSNTMMILDPKLGDVEYQSTRLLITNAIVKLKEIELLKEEAKKTTF
jgi:hypothetical protein